MTCIRGSDGSKQGVVAAPPGRPPAVCRVSLTVAHVTFLVPDHHLPLFLMDNQGGYNTGGQGMTQGGGWMPPIRQEMQYLCAGASSMQTFACHSLNCDIQTVLQRTRSRRASLSGAKNAAIVSCTRSVPSAVC